MANVNELFDEIKNEKSYFKPENSSSEKKRYARNIEGEFLGHIFDAETRIVEFKGYKARVLPVTKQISVRGGTGSKRGTKYYAVYTHTK